MCDTQLAALSKAYDIQKEDIDRRHAREIEKQKLDWRALSVLRKDLWAEWEREFGQSQGRGRADQGSTGRGDSRAQAPSPARHRLREQFADPRRNAKAQSPKPDDSRPQQQFNKEIILDTPPPKPGWKRRRSTAERKADGSYRPRTRRGPTPGR